MSHTVCGPLGCIIIHGRYVPGKAVLDAEGQLVYSRDPDAVDVRQVRRLRRARLRRAVAQQAPQVPAPANVVYVPHDSPLRALGGFDRRPDGSARWTGR
jgi:hypothetical protein